VIELVYSMLLSNYNYRNKMLKHNILTFYIIKSIENT